MKWCVSFPEEEILIVRPSLNAICAGNRAAAKLLSVLLYRYSIRKESREDAENINEVEASKGKEPTQDTSFRIYRKQEQLVKDMCGEIVEKTLHDVAVPTLQLLGYLDIDESGPIICYDLHPDVVSNAMEAYKKGPKQLEKFLISSIQLEKFLIEREELEKVLINKKNFQLALEKVLIANRKSSNCKRGRKPASEKGEDTKKAKPQINRENIEINNKTTTDAVASPSQSKSSQKEKTSPSKNQPREKKPIPLKQPELPKVEEPDLSHLSEQERDIYSRLRPQDQKIYLSWSQQERAPYNNYLGTMGYAVIVNITPAVERTVKQFKDVQPSIQDFKDIAAYAKKIEKKKPQDQRYYSTRGMKFWDYASEYVGWKSSLEMNKPEEQTGQPAPQPNAPRKLTDLEKRQREMAAKYMKKAN